LTCVLCCITLCANAQKTRYNAGIKSFQNPSHNLCPSSQTIKVNLKNYGTSELDSVKINWSINNKKQIQYNWNGKLPTDSIAVVSLGNYTFNQGTDTLRAWTSLPDGFKDSVPENDSSMAIDTVFAFPKAFTGGNQSICPQGRITLGDSAEAGYSYSWTSRPAGFTSNISNPLVNPAVQTTYYLTETSTGGGCSKSDSATISLYPVTPGNVGGNHTVCQGTNVTLGNSIGSADITFWSTKSSGIFSTVHNPVVKPNATTTYFLFTSSLNPQCYKTDSAVITVIPTPKAFISNKTMACFGDSLKLGTAAVSANAYTWSSKPVGFSSNISDPAVKASATLTYYLTEKNILFGCSHSDSLTILVNPLPSPSAGTDQGICPDRTVSLGYTGTTGDTYQWTSIPSGFHAKTPSITDSPKTQTTYILTETIPTTGCSNTDTVVVNINPSPNPIITTPPMLCAMDSTGVFQANKDSVADWKWSVENGFLLSGDGTNMPIMKFDAGIDTIWVTETNGFGCQNRTGTTVLVRQNPNAHFNWTGGPNYLFKAADSSEQYYSWDFGDGAKANSSTVSHSYAFGHDSMVKVSLTVGSAFGCSSVFDTLIEVVSTGTHIKVYPNPFLISMQIKVELDKTAQVKIVVYDALGKDIGTIANEQQPAGAKTYTLDADKYHLAAAAYFIKVLVDDKVFVQPVIRIE